MNKKLSQGAQRLMVISAIFSICITSFSTLSVPAARAQAPTVILDKILMSYWDTPNPADSNCGPGGRPVGQYAVEPDGGAGAAMSWINAPAGSYVDECWTTEFHQVGLTAGDLVKVCTTGDFPYKYWSDRLNPLAGSVWPADGYGLA